MANTFVKIASGTVGSGGASSISLTSIPSTYTDLVLKVSLRTDTTGSGNGFAVYLNGSTSSYNRIGAYGDGSTVSSNSVSAAAGGLVNGTTETANTFASTDIYIPNYTGSTFKATSHDSVMESNATFAYGIISCGLWSNTSAVTSMTITPQAGNFVQYTTATLYGIKKN